MVAHVGQHCQKSGEHLEPLQAQLQIILERRPCAILPHRGASKKRQDHGRTTAGHPS